MNITSKRLDKIKKTKNQSKRRIHYKNKKKNGKEKNRRKNRKYNKSTGKYRKTHKQKKRAYDLKNKSLKFKENQPGKKPAPLKIITTDKPVETVQTGGALVWKNFKKLFRTANTKKKEEIDGLQDEIFKIIKVDKDNDHVADFYKWYIDELLKIAYPPKGNNKIYTSKHSKYDETLSSEIKTAIDKLNKKTNNELYKEENKKHLITIFKLTLTDDKKHLKVLFDGKAIKTRQIAVREAKLEKTNGKSWKLTTPDKTSNIYNFINLTKKMDEILEKVKEAEQIRKDNEAADKKRKEDEVAEQIRKDNEAAAKKAQEERDRVQKEAQEKAEAAKEAAKKAQEERDRVQKEAQEKAEEEAAKKAEKKMKTEEEINNIKTNIKTPEFKAFLEKVKHENGPYKDFLSHNVGFKKLIESVVLGQEGEIVVVVEGENQLTAIYDYLMKNENQTKIRNSLTNAKDTDAKDTDELINFNAMIESIKFAEFAGAPYDHPPHDPRIIVVKQGVPKADQAIISPNTHELNTTDVFGDLGDFTKHVEAAKEVVDGKSQQSGGEQEIYNMMLEYYKKKEHDQWNEDNWLKLGKELAGLIEDNPTKTVFVNDLSGGEFGEALQVATAMGKVLENIDGENEMKIGSAYAKKNDPAKKYDLDTAIDSAMSMAMGKDEMGVFNLKAIIRGTDPFDCGEGPEKVNGKRSIGHFDSFVKIEGGDKYVHFDALTGGTQKDGSLKIVNINDYLHEDLCRYLIFLFNNDENYPKSEDLKVSTDGNGNNRCWINATLYAVLFGIMNKEGKLSEVKEEERIEGEDGIPREIATQNVAGRAPSEVIEDEDEEKNVKSNLKRKETRSKIMRNQGEEGKYKEGVAKDKIARNKVEEDVNINKKHKKRKKKKRRKEEK